MSLEKLREEPPALRTRSRLSDYTLKEMIGEGAYGRVFKAEHNTTKRLVALKRIRLDREREGFPLTAFREIRFLLKMKGHPNAVELLDIIAEVASTSSGEKSKKRSRDECDDWGRASWASSPMPCLKRVYMVFEFVEHDLSGLLQSRFPITAAHAQCYAYQLLDGLRHLAKHGVLHRDIKASNLLISSSNVLKIADWGLARSLSLSEDHGTNLRYTSPVVTLWYRAPELLLGAQRYDASIDAWSAGCVLLELVNRRPIFLENSEAAQIALLFSYFGEPTKETWPDAEKLPKYDEATAGLIVSSEISFAEKFQPMCGKLGLFQLFSAAEKLLVMNPKKRFSCAQLIEWGRNEGEIFNYRTTVEDHLDPELHLKPETLPVIRMPSAHEYSVKVAKRKGQGVPAPTAGHFAVQRSYSQRKLSPEKHKVPQDAAAAARKRNRQGEWQRPGGRDVMHKTFADEVHMMEDYGSGVLYNNMSSAAPPRRSQGTTPIDKLASRNNRAGPPDAVASDNDDLSLEQPTNGNTTHSSNSQRGNNAVTWRQSRPRESPAAFTRDSNNFPRNGPSERYHNAPNYATRDEMNHYGANVRGMSERFGSSAAKHNTREGSGGDDYRGSGNAQDYPVNVHDFSAKHNTREGSGGDDYRGGGDAQDFPVNVHDFSGNVHDLSGNVHGFSGNAHDFSGNGHNFVRDRSDRFDHGAAYQESIYYMETGGYHEEGADQEYEYEHPRWNSVQSGPGRYEGDAPDRYERGESYDGFQGHYPRDMQGMYDGQGGRYGPRENQGRFRDHSGPVSRRPSREEMRYKPSNNHSHQRPPGRQWHRNSR